MKNFVSVNDVSDLNRLINIALAYKADPLKDASLGNGKKIGLLFLNPSLRTRISTQVAAQNLGVTPIVFNVDKEGWAMEFADDVIMNGSTVEHIKDAAPVLGQYFDMIGIRTFPGLNNREEDYAETILNKIINYTGVPVISLESATLHPLQSLADAVTISELMQQKNISRPKVVLTWAPHMKPLPQCVANSFSQWMTGWDKVDFVITHPEGYHLSPEFTQGAVVTHNQEEALQSADFLYVKNWSSFEDYGQMPGLHNNWMLTQEKLQLTNNANVMHCLPVRRNLELSGEILDGPNSIVKQQAGNRVWSAQAVISEILRNNT